MKRSPMKRSSKPLPQESARRKAERATRQSVREAALARAGHRCSGPGIVPEIACWGPLDVDEIKSRGVNPGGHLDDSNVQVLCRAHHDWRTQNPREARQRGLRLESWEETPARPAPLPGLMSPLAVANTLPVHDPRGGTVEWMCQAIQLPDGRRFYAPSSMIEDGIEIPDALLAKACEALDPGGDPFDESTCFCCVDAELLCTGLGWSFTIDELGDVITS